MDLQAAQMTREKRGLVGRFAPILCLALAGALLIGSLVNTGRANPHFHGKAGPVSTAKIPS